MTLALVYISPVLSMTIHPCQITGFVRQLSRFITPNYVGLRISRWAKASYTRYCCRLNRICYGALLSACDKLDLHGVTNEEVSSD